MSSPKVSPTPRLSRDVVTAASDLTQVIDLLSRSTLPEYTPKQLLVGFFNDANQFIQNLRESGFPDLANKFIAPMKNFKALGKDIKTMNELK